jgi:hypothetical protein
MTRTSDDTPPIKIGPSSHGEPKSSAITVSFRFVVLLPESFFDWNVMLWLLSTAEHCRDRDTQLECKHKDRDYVESCWPEPSEARVYNILDYDHYATLSSSISYSLDSGTV